MPRKRKTINKGLPTGWSIRHGAYYYHVPKAMRDRWEGKQLFRLGGTISEAYKVWASKVEQINKAKTIAQILDRYMAEYVPTKAPASQVGDRYSHNRIRPVFGPMFPASITPQDIYIYADKRGAPVQAKREIAFLSHALTKAVQWGDITEHPFKGEIILANSKPRTRYIEDWEIIECLSLPKVRKLGSVLAIQAYIRLKLLTGMRRSDMLRIRLADCKEDGIHVTPHKTENSSGKATIYEWSAELRNAVDMAKAARLVDISPLLFCNKYGESYLDENGLASGWDSMWQRFMSRILKETEITERFTEHDLRAKVGSDAVTLEHARQLLAHADSKTTNRFYRRKAEIVKPAK